MFRFLNMTAIEEISLDHAGFFQRPVRAVLIDRLKTARGNPNAHELIQLRHPDAVFVQIWSKNPGHVFCHVTADSALFLGHTAPVNNAAARRSRSCDAANS
jgi:hypothetical protein